MVVLDNLLVDCKAKCCTVTPEIIQNRKRIESSMQLDYTSADTVPCT